MRFHAPIILAIAMGAILAPPASAALISQGGVRVGADALWSRGILGQGQTVAVIDKGFAGLDRSIALGELPPRQDMTIQLFDPATGLDGSDEFGAPSVHGVRMAELIHDMAPQAHLVAGGLPHHGPVRRGGRLDRRPGHPGRDPLQLVPDAAVRRHRPRGARRGRGRRRRRAVGQLGGQLRPAPLARRRLAGGVAIPIAPNPGDPLLYSLAWASPAVTASLSVEQQDPSGAWVEVQRSTPASPINAVTSPLITVGGTYRVVVRQDAGPPAELDLFSRTVGFGAMAVADGSIPTPGDAAGAVSVGAVKWTGTTIEPYSSNGRVGQGKPDLVAPTYVTSNPEWPGTAGTSASAPHVAGVAVLLRQQRLAAGLPADRATLRALLVGGAQDLGAPGFDPAFGAGMVRADTSAPAARVRVSAGPTRVVRVLARDAGTIRQVRISMNGRSLRLVRRPVVGVRLPALRRGANRLVVTAEDMAGNVATRTLTLRGPR